MRCRGPAPPANATRAVLDPRRRPASRRRPSARSDREVARLGAPALQRSCCLVDTHHGGEIEIAGPADRVARTPSAPPRAAVSDQRQVANRSILNRYNEYFILFFCIFRVLHIQARHADDAQTARSFGGILVVAGVPLTRGAKADCTVLQAHRGHEEVLGSMDATVPVGGDILVTDRGPLFASSVSAHSIWKYIGPSVLLEAVNWSESAPYSPPWRGSKESSSSRRCRNSPPRCSSTSSAPSGRCTVHPSCCRRSGANCRSARSRLPPCSGHEPRPGYICCVLPEVAQDVDTHRVLGAAPARRRP